MSLQKKILLVDDEPQVLLAMELRLRQVDYDVVVAHDGVEGLEAAIREQPAAIVLDVRMPKMSGLEMLDAIHAIEETKQVPIVMVSASIIDQQDARQRGASYFLQKPFDLQELLQALGNVVRSDPLQRV